MKIREVLKRFYFPASHEYDPQRVMENNELRDRIRCVLSRMPKKYAEILELVCINDLPSGEIAHRFQIKAGVTRWRLSKARKMFIGKYTSLESADSLPHYVRNTVNTRFQQVHSNGNGAVEMPVVQESDKKLEEHSPPEISVLDHPSTGTNRNSQVTLSLEDRIIFPDISPVTPATQSAGSKNGIVDGQKLVSIKRIHRPSYAAVLETVSRIAPTLADAGMIIDYFQSRLSHGQQKAIQIYIETGKWQSQLKSALAAMGRMTQHIAIAKMVYRGAITDLGVLAPQGANLEENCKQLPANQALTIYLIAAGYSHERTAKILHTTTTKIAEWQRNATGELRKSLYSRYM